MAANEGWVFAGTDWNDGTNFDLEEFDPGIAPKRIRWISGADSDGALSPEEAHYENAEMTVRVRVVAQSTMDLALAKIGTLVEALQEAEKQPLGSAGVWTPATSTKSLTAYVLAGEVTGLPIDLNDSGWFVKSPIITMKLTRRPFLYGAEVTSAATVTNTEPLQVLTIPSVAGDVAAEGRLVITDAATQSRRHVEWGLEQRYYNAATSLILDSDSMVTTGFSGTGTTRAGAYDPGAAGNSVIRGTLTTTPVAVCGTGNLSHVGTFRVKARVYASNPTYSNTFIRLSWKEGDGPLRANDYTQPCVGANWAEVDLGTIAIPEKALGTQRWTGQIESYTAGPAVADTLDVDVLYLIPTESYGKARTTITLPTSTTFSARDEFNQTAGNLNAKALPVGGTWTTSGDATDLAVETTGKTAQRSTTVDTNGRTALATTASLTDVVASVDFTWSALPASGLSSTVLTRDGHVWAAVGTSGSVTYLSLVLDGTVLATKSVMVTAGVRYTLTVMALSSGIAAGFLGRAGSGAADYTLTASDPQLATGGLRAAGTGHSFKDVNTSATAVTRNYDNFAVWVPATDAVVFSGRAAEFRHDSAIRQDSTGTYYGNVATYRGDRFYVPADGSANRTTRIAAKARRNDIELATDDQIADSTTVTVHLTPRYYAAPR